MEILIGEFVPEDNKKECITVFLIDTGFLFIPKEGDKVVEPLSKFDNLDMSVEEYVNTNFS